MPRSQKINHPKNSSNYIPLSKRALKIAIYVRVSTHHQIDKESLPFQKQELENYCKYILNTDNFVIFEDAGYSAKNTDRPQYQEMMSRIRLGEFTHLLVWKLDRISRNLRDFTEMWDELKEYDVNFVSKMEQFDTSTAMGEAMLRIILVFAELERKLTAERVYSLMLDRASKGAWNGAPVSLGFDWDEENKTIVINEDEADLIRLIYTKYEKVQSAALLAQWLHENGKRTKRGGTWGSKTVIDILRNPIYMGTYRWNYRKGGRGDLKPEDEVITKDDAVPAIITREQWERVQKLLDSNYKGCKDNRRNKHPHMLSGLIKCAYCGRTYLAGRNSRPHKNNYHPSDYRCGTYVRNRQCHNKPISGLQIEPFILEYIRAYVITSKNLKDKDKFAEQLLLNFGKPEIQQIELTSTDTPLASSIIDGMVGTATIKAPNTDDDELIILKRQKQRIELAMDKLDDTYYFPEGNNVITKSEYLVKKANFQDKLKKADTEISAITARTSVSMPMDIELLSHFLLVHDLYTTQNIREILPDIDVLVAQDFLNQIITFIEVADKRVTKIGFNSPGGEIIHQFIYE